MNEGDSAGGGHQGCSPAPPAVTDRRSAIAINTSSQLSNENPQIRSTSGSAVPVKIVFHHQCSQIYTKYTPNALCTGNQNQQALQDRSIVNQTGLGTISQKDTSINSNISAKHVSSEKRLVNAVTISLPQSIDQVNDCSETSSAARKRFRCELVQTRQQKISKLCVLSAGSGVVSSIDINLLKRRILECKFTRLRSIKEKYSEHVAELFFLQTGGNMMDYPMWRKKPPTPQFINFTKSYRLDGCGSEEANDQDHAASLNSPRGAEIKIPGIGATPVAVSKTLPAAVVQLTQKGHIPGRPQGGRHGMVFGQIPVSSTLRNSSVPLVPGGTPILPDAQSLHGSPKQVSALTVATDASTLCMNGGDTAGNNQDPFSIKAKQEVYVMQRISELQREGLWTEKRLPKLQEPLRPKVHWDYLLEEMVWLAADFAQERKWKKSAAKKCARMVQKYFHDKINAAQKAEKAQELHLKRVAAFIAKEVKLFWANVEKLVDYKHQTKLEQKRKRALDQHLRFIVDQTEKFSQQLAEGMNRPLFDKNAIHSINLSRVSSPNPKQQYSDDEFRPSDGMSEDDEETIAKAEAEEDNVNDEVAALQRESAMDLEELLQELPKDYLNNRETLFTGSDSDKPYKDKEFLANDDSEDDDEETIREQEATEKDVDYQQELHDLNVENDLSVEELMVKYSGVTKTHNKVQRMEVESDDGDDECYNSNDMNSDMSGGTYERSADEESSDSSDVDETVSDEGLRILLLEDNENCLKEAKDSLIKDAAAIAESIQPKGNTLSSTDVVTPIPFLLKHSLREYQHIGLDWLVTMNERKLNGILADEMGLGKTIQTIALLAHLACMKGNWGPHLIVVPSSVILNWEMEFKKWCPGFKILTYYGTQKERKHKRMGWTKPNAFHVCVTSYKLVIQDQQSFRRKKWKYLILDEAQNIKNFKSQRWQLLLNFQTERRLLLTGTPLQNNLMELWSLMHFLMPHVFQSHREFKEWFSNPMTGMIEGNSEYNDSIIKRLHKVLRPFLLRRLKSEVEKQMPKKYEHIVMCRLSKRQRYLYDDFMSRAKTRETLACGNLLSVINVLMQLRKVCNHPNLFESRPTLSPFRTIGLVFQTASLVCQALEYNPLKDIDLSSFNLILLQLEVSLTAYASHRTKKLATPSKLIEELDSLPKESPRCPAGKYKFHVRIKDSRVRRNLASNSGVKVGTSPAMKTEGNKLVPIINVDKNHLRIDHSSQNRLNVSLNNFLSSYIVGESTSSAIPTSVPLVQYSEINRNINHSSERTIHSIYGDFGRNFDDSAQSNSPIKQNGAQMFANKTVVDTVNEKISTSTARSGNFVPQNLVSTLAQQFKTNSLSLSFRKKSRNNTEYHFVEREKLNQDWRQSRRHLMAKINIRRCDGVPIYGSDLRKSVANLVESNCRASNSTWYSRSYVNVLQSSVKRDNWSLTHLIKSYEERTSEMVDTLSKYVLYVPAASAPIPILKVRLHPSKQNENKALDFIIRDILSPKLTLLHRIISAMNTQFPDPRLIQYDCGKLQTLDRLLRNLKYEGHRVLIFTQMTKMLDVLEAFLNYHGHIYLRLDGTTRIEQRQVLMERFNADKRIFAFILSTRSGGVGVNLTGADTVIFYDSDWNPTMDAQAQDRCHRIGQTRDVHIYRLVSEKTIEENILRKANQKRLLGDLAIEGGNFTTAYFKSSTIQDLFHVENEDDANVRLSEVLGKDRDRRQRLQENFQQSVSSSNGGDEKIVLGAFESALAAAEDEQDVEAATVAKAEAAADLEEFDENIPLEELNDKSLEMSKADLELEHIVKQLSPIERYAMRFVEETGGAWTAEQLRVAEAEIEQQKREWEANRLAALQKEEEILKAEEQNEDYITYSREDAKNQIWISDNALAEMPIWCPPTPPQNDNDIYIDYSLNFLYETDIMPESHLPPIYVKKEGKRNRFEAGFGAECRPLKLRKEDSYNAPRSIFDRPSPALLKLRRDLKLQRFRGVYKPTMPVPGIKPTILTKPLMEPEGMAEWYIYEDVAILHVVQNLQGFPLNLMLLSPGHTPNWDLVADVVNQYSRTYRSPKQCRYRYEAVIVPREEGKLLESPKKHKKLKSQIKSSVMKGGVKSMRTSQMFISDNNNMYSKLMKAMFENIKTAYLKKAPPPKQVFGVQTQKNPKHVAILNEFGVTSYESPLNPIEIALKKAEKIKEKQRISLSVHQPLEVQQTVRQSLALQQPAILIQQPPTQVATVVQQVAQIMQTSPLQRQTPQASQLSTPQPSAQMVKAIVTPSSSIGAGFVSNISQQNSQPISLQQAQIQTPCNVTPSSVSVVLSTPVPASTVHQMSVAQIVSLQQQSLGSSPSIVTQTTNATPVQTISTQSLPQVVSVSQLATSGSVPTTSTILQSNTPLTALNASTIRGQRIVASSAQIQEVVLQQRTNAQSPTIVSMSSLNQSGTQPQLHVSQPQLQATQLRVTPQVLAKSITVGSLQQTSKLGNHPTAIQLYRQQPIRQQLKVLQTSTGQANTAATVVQTATGQTALVNASGALVQGGIVPGQAVQVHGQKIATVSTSVSTMTSVATVQVAPVQGRTQFIKQINSGGKQAIARSVNDNEMVLVKRSMLGQHKQMISQSQIYAQPNVQLQPQGTSGQQQIATLVKTSQGAVTASVGMTLSQLKPGPIKVTMANQNQVRQLQLQQHIAIAQQRKAGKPQITQIAGKAGLPTQLIVQNSKNLTNSVTVQQVIRQPGGSLGGQLVFGKTSVGRVIPVSVASQANARQTIQVVSAASAQALTSGNMRSHVTNTSNLANTIKVAANATQAQTQQALINALQQSQQNHQRQNVSPVRLQTSGAPLVAVPMQVQSTTSIGSSTSGGAVDVLTLAHPQQQQTTQQVKNLVKKKLMVRSDKE